MKHQTIQSEDRGFHLSSARQMRCRNIIGVTICGQCDSCLMSPKVVQFREWFSRFGNQSKKYFMLGLVQRIESKALLQNLVSMLLPTIGKDSIYARARTNPSLNTDTATLSSDHAIDTDKIEQVIEDTWEWFLCSSYYTKMNFTLNILQVCDSQLLHILFKQAKTLLTEEGKTNQFLAGDDTNEVTSVAPFDYCKKSYKHAVIDQLSCSEFNTTVNNCTNGETISKSREKVIHDTRFITTASNSSLGRDSLWKSTAAEAYSGVSEHKDIVRYLPVHLSKMILGMLDTRSLHNAICVSPNWRKLAEEVRLEISVSRVIQEEVTHMQGSVAQGANAVYAKDIDVLVPNLKPGTHDVIYTDNNVTKATFKREHSFSTAYRGVVTRKVIMEERNIFCGNYNVMVIVDSKDKYRVIHTDGSKIVAIGSDDRKVKFADCTTGKEIGPIIKGHAGSVTCCYLIHDKDMVVSGSYDTSVRCWSIKTGKCLKILRGHQGTVNCIMALNHLIATGSRDTSCKIWNLESGKCLGTLKHRTPVLAIALSEEICVSGCESGKVKVWEMESHNLIKVLSGHQSSVMGIKFDRWHIITGSQDGYTLVWSTVGNHSRCLTALKHPKEVLCLEFAYLRVVTGCSDGYIRIWNIITGQCCRMMRGNSQSDPILAIIATGNRITVNTLNSLLVFNFENVYWDYSLESDKVSPSVQHASNSDASCRLQPHSYVRAQRMRQVGASNSKIVHHDTQDLEVKNKFTCLHCEHNTIQLPHSGKSQSIRSLQSTKHAQSSLKSLDFSFADTGASSYVSSSLRKLSNTYQSVEPKENIICNKKIYNCPSVQCSDNSKARDKSALSQIETIATEKLSSLDNCKNPISETPQINRRVSWAFETPVVYKDKDISLSEMKSLLRSQIRLKTEEIVPPEFITRTVDIIKKSMIVSGINCPSKVNVLGSKDNFNKVIKRPSSSPSRIDPRTKVPVQKSRPESSHKEDIISSPDITQFTNEKHKPNTDFSKESLITVCMATSLNTSVPVRFHPNTVRTTIPEMKIVRPISAGPTTLECRQASQNTAHRPSTSPVKPGSSSLKYVPLNIASFLPGAGSQSYKYTSDHLSTTGEEASHVPMIVYTKDAIDKIKQLQIERKMHRNKLKRNLNAQQQRQTKRSTDFIKRPIKFEMRTHHQEQDHLQESELIYAEQKEKDELQLRSKNAWLEMATRKPTDFISQL